MMMYFSQIQKTIAANKILAKGYLYHNIENLQNDLGVSLPEAYIEFLLIFGLEPAGFMLGYDIKGQYLIDIQEEANEIMIRNGESAFGKNCLVFCIHQNYSFYAFKLDGVQDPEVFLFVEGGEEFEMWTKCGKFSSFINEKFLFYLENNYLKIEK
jgi:hypothetical protein